MQSGSASHPTGTGSACLHDALMRAANITNITTAEPACRELYQLVRSLCFCCGRVRLTPELRAGYERKLRALLAGDVEAAHGVQTDAAAARASSKRANGAGAMLLQEGGDELVQGEVRSGDAYGRCKALPSSIVAALQEALSSLFADVAKHVCPSCSCAQPKLKRAGKLAIIVQPLTPKQLAKNAANGVELKCAR